MPKQENVLSNFGVKVYANKGAKKLQEVAREAGIDTKVLWALMYDTCLKQKVADVLNFKF